MTLDILSALPAFSGRDQHENVVDSESYAEEMAAFSRMQQEFSKRNCKLLGCSPDSVSSHANWLKDVESISGVRISFSVIADENGHICRQLGCVVEREARGIGKRAKSEQITRSLYIVEPNRTIQYVQVMPQNTGRDLSEVLRVLDSVQLSTLREVVATPADWKVGNDVVLLPNASDSDIKTKLANAITKATIFPYLRFVQLEQEEVS